MKKTIITCDVCKVDKDCVTVNLNLGGNHLTNKSFDVCRDCCIETNIFEEKFNPQYGYIATTANSYLIYWKKLLEMLYRNKEVDKLKHENKNSETEVNCEPTKCISCNNIYRCTKQEMSAESNEWEEGVKP